MRCFQLNARLLILVLILLNAHCLVAQVALSCFDDDRELMNRARSLSKLLSLPISARDGMIAQTEIEPRGQAVLGYFMRELHKMLQDPPFKCAAIPIMLLRLTLFAARSKTFLQWEDLYENFKNGEMGAFSFECTALFIVSACSHRHVPEGHDFPHLD